MQTTNFTDAEIIEIRTKYKKGKATYRELADEFYTTRSTIMSIVKGKLKKYSHIRLMGEPKHRKRIKDKLHFSDKQIKNIREKYASGKYTYIKLAQEYKISPQTVSRIVNGNIYKHLPVLNKPNLILRKTSKLNRVLVSQMRLLFTTGKYTIKNLANKFGIHPVYCSKVLHGHYYSCPIHDPPLCFPIPSTSQRKRSYSRTEMPSKIREQIEKALLKKDSKREVAEKFKISLYQLGRILNENK